MSFNHLYEGRSDNPVYALDEYIVTATVRLTRQLRAESPGDAEDIFRALAACWPGVLYESEITHVDVAAVADAG